VGLRPANQACRGTKFTSAAYLAGVHAAGRKPVRHGLYREIRRKIVRLRSRRGGRHAAPHVSARRRPSTPTTVLTHPRAVRTRRSRGAMPVSRDAFAEDWPGPRKARIILRQDQISDECDLGGTAPKRPYRSWHPGRLGHKKLGSAAATSHRRRRGLLALSAPVGYAGSALC